MKLDLDCIRDILLVCEATITFNKGYSYSKYGNSELLQKYSHDEIIYHISQAKNSNLIRTSAFYDNGEHVIIYDITSVGHEFLANIRTQTVWKKIKEKGIQSLPVILSLAKDFALAFYQKN